MEAQAQAGARGCCVPAFGSPAALAPQVPWGSEGGQLSSAAPSSCRVIAQGQLCLQEQWGSALSPGRPFHPGIAQIAKGFC